MTEVITKFATIIAEAAVSWVQSGGNITVYLFALIGVFMLIISTLQKAGKLFTYTFIIFIAIPLIMIEEFMKRKKEARP